MSYDCPICGETVPRNGTPWAWLLVHLSHNHRTWIPPSGDWNSSASACKHTLERWAWDGTLAEEVKRLYVIAQLTGE